jgi:hypothetical protein
MNILRNRIGLSLITEAPTSTEIPAVTLPTITLDLDGSFTAEFNAGNEWNAAGGGILVSASPLLSSGRNYNSQFTDVGNTLFPGGTPIAFQLPYSTIAGGRIVLRYRATTPDGRLSDLVYQTITTPAQAIIQSIVVNSAILATVNFANAVDANDFGPGDWTGAFQTTVSALAQGTANQIVLTGTGFTAAAGYTLTPNTPADLYTPIQSGITI